MSIEIAIQNLADAINNLANISNASSRMVAAELENAVAEVEQAAKAPEKETKQPELAADVKEVKKPAAPAEDAPDLDYEKDVKPKLIKFLTKHGKQKGIELLASYGAKTGNDVKVSDFPALLAEIEAAA